MKFSGKVWIDHGTTLAMALALEVWPYGQNLGRLQNSPLTSIDWSTVTGVNYISRSTFLTYLQWAIVAL